MVRIAKFSSEAFVEAAVVLVAEGGPSAASIAAIARRVGAPTGSVYHRFESRSAVLATAWITAYRSFVERIIPPLEAGRPAATATAIIAWTREDARRGRFLLLNDADSLFEDVPPPENLRLTLAKLEETLDQAFQDGLSVMVGPGRAVDAETTARARFMIFDSTIALLRPHLLAHSPIPDFVDHIVGEMHDAVSLPPGRTSGAVAAAAP